MEELTAAKLQNNQSQHVECKHAACDANLDSHLLAKFCVAHEHHDLHGAASPGQLERYYPSSSEAICDEHVDLIGTPLQRSPCASPPAKLEICDSGNDHPAAAQHEAYEGDDSCYPRCRTFMCCRWVSVRYPGACAWHHSKKETGNG
mmetsp:Transcript_17882/g.45809  ORF Transcript_17882/g.45809 Transcript_17882/m.45809 type:complete len:147 (-) Transcript_17882:540-980(-)|eukprot:2681231-Prymnesium_polylepis.1